MLPHVLVVIDWLVEFCSRQLEILCIASVWAEYMAMAYMADVAIFGRIGVGGDLFLSACLFDKDIRVKRNASGSRKAVYIGLTQERAEAQ